MRAHGPHHRLAARVGTSSSPRRRCRRVVGPPHDRVTIVVRLPRDNDAGQRVEDRDRDAPRSDRTTSARQRCRTRRFPDTSVAQPASTQSAVHGSQFAATVSQFAVQMRPHDTFPPPDVACPQATPTFHALDRIGQLAASHALVAPDELPAPVGRRRSLRSIRRRAETRASWTAP